MPLVVIRAVLMELDCFVFRKRQLKCEQQIESNGENCQSNQPTLPNTLSENLKSKDISCRLYVALLCSIIGIFAVIIFLLILGTLLYMALA